MIAEQESSLETKPGVSLPSRNTRLSVQEPRSEKNSEPRVSLLRALSAWRSVKSRKAKVVEGRKEETVG
jgi:hypothetical protein